MANPPKLYDCFWASRGRADVKRPVADGKHGGMIVTLPIVKAAILYPAFLTPAMYFAESPLNKTSSNIKEYLQLVIAAPRSGKFSSTNTDVTNCQIINERLIFRRNLRWTRRARPAMEPLFSSVGDAILLKQITPVDLGDHGTLLETDSFSGVLQPLWNKHFAAMDDLEFWDVRVRKDALLTCERGANDGPLVEDESDRAIGTLLKRRGEGAFTKPLTFRIEEAAHGFRIFPEHVEDDRPLLAHHPIAVYEGPFTAEAPPLLQRFLHVTDLHLNMRQDLLAQSPARVIEKSDERGQPADLDEYPPVGALVHRYDRSIGDILMAGEGAERPDCIVMGGDVVDHIRNATPMPGALLPVSACAVWNQVGLDGDYRKHYRAGPDMIAAFTLFREVVSRRELPMLGITGNHDAYTDGYGISPRVINSRLKRKLANDGIAADHNLTFYEAILAFGPSYHEFTNAFNFNPEWLDWYHTIFSPFSDCAIELPKQRVVALGWGQSENMLSLPNGQGIGHLPRASDGMRLSQLNLIQNGFDATRPTLLVSHFTLASFLEDIPESPENGKLRHGKIGFTGVAPYSDYDYGTFQDRRDEAYLYTGTRPGEFSALLNGHSHRKALYFIEPTSTNGGTVHMVGLASGHQDRLAVPRDVRDLLPVVLSDSAGPLPRSNVDDEFSAWGSDAAAGSLLELTNRGKLSKVTTKRSEIATAKPRAAVAFDYVHHQYGTVWKGFTTIQFESYPAKWRRRSGQALGPIGMSVNLDPRWSRYGINASEVRFIGRVPPDKAAQQWSRDSWIDVRVPTTSPSGRTQKVQQRVLPVYDVSVQDLPKIEQWIDEIPTSNDRFLAVRFSVDDVTESADMIPRVSRQALKARYDWDSWWIFEVMIRDVATIGSNRWVVCAKSNSMSENDTSNSRPVVEQPSFSHRKQAYRGTYTSSITTEGRTRP